jgi:hypothetical protein
VPRELTGNLNSTLQASATSFHVLARNCTGNIGKSSNLASELLDKTMRAGSSLFKGVFVESVAIFSMDASSEADREGALFSTDVSDR